MSQRHPYCFLPAVLEINWPTTEPVAEPTTLIPLPPRHFDCLFYEQCLDDAVRAKWPSWSCTACRAYCPLGPFEQQRDAPGLLRLWGVVAAEPW